jgi:hypothetical protein
MLKLSAEKPADVAALSDYVVASYSRRTYAPAYRIARSTKLLFLFLAIALSSLTSCGGGDRAATVTVPNVVGLTQAAATTAIENAGLAVGSITTQSSPTPGAGLIISESPTAGSTAALGSAINLFVSSGGQTVPTSIGASVPAAASGLITTFYSAGTTVAVGGAIPTLADGSVPVLFAGDGINDPLLLAIGSTTGTLDANTTSIGIVRATLGLVTSQAPLTSSVLAAAIQASSHYAQLLSDVNTALNSGQPPIDSDAVVQDALIVAQDAIVTLNTNGVLAAGSPARVKSAAIQVNPPLPYYFINNSEPYNRLWLADDSGTSNVNVMNQTFIAWQFTTTNAGAPLDSEIAPPLASSYKQLAGYYGGSASTTMLIGTSPEFTLTLSQSDTTKNTNSLLVLTQFANFLASAASGAAPTSNELLCFSTGLSTLFDSDLATLVAQPTGAAAEAYLKSIFLSASTLPNFYKLYTTCGSITPPVTPIFGTTISKLWTAINLSKAGVSTIGTAAETFSYWNYPSQDYLVCKTNDGITAFPCITLQLSPAAPTVAVGAATTLTVSAVNADGASIPIPSPLNWSSDTESVATVLNGVVTGVAGGTATITVTDPVSAATASVEVTVTTATTTYPYPGPNWPSSAPTPVVPTTLASSASFSGSGCPSNQNTSGAGSEYIVPPFRTGPPLQWDLGGVLWPGIQGIDTTQALTIVNGGVSESSGLNYDPAPVDVGTYPPMSGIGSMETYTASVSGTALAEKWVGNIQNVSSTASQNLTYTFTSSYDMVSGLQSFTFDREADGTTQNTGITGCMETYHNSETGSTTYNWITNQ